MYKDFNGVQSIIGSMNKAVEALKIKHNEVALIGDIRLTVREVNNALYGSSRLIFEKDYDLSIEKEYADYVNELEHIIAIWGKQ